MAPKIDPPKVGVPAVSLEEVALTGAVGVPLEGNVQSAIIDAFAGPANKAYVHAAANTFLKTADLFILN
jgi:hypothetical protein